MNMKYTAVAAAVAAALGTSGAYALPTSTTPDLTVVQFGSSAVELPIQQVWTDVCAAGTLTIYEDAPTSGSSYRDYFCTLGTSASIPAGLQGKHMLYEERLTGGSIYGVNPVANSTAESYMDLSTCTAGVASGTTTCTAATLASGVPDVGISDVEPKLFTGANVPSGFAALTSAQLGNLHVDPLLQQTFAVGVGSGVSGTVKNLSSADIASIISGKVTDWHTINQALAVGTKITTCLRTAGSGTQAGANALFLSNPCAPSGAAPISSTATFNSSTGTMISCLDNNADSFGIVSLADGPKSGDSFSTVSVDSVAPSAANAAIGAYKYNVESTLQYLTSLDTSTLKGELIVALHTILSTPSSLATVNGGLPAPALNAEQAGGYTPNSPYLASNPVEWGTRGGNTCSPYILTFPQ